jgi:hypothetical protein
MRTRNQDFSTNLSIRDESQFEEGFEKVILHSILTVLGSESRIGRTIVLDMKGQLALAISARK